MRGFCRIFVFESFNNAFAVAVPTDTAKSVEFKWARLYSVGLVVVVVVDEDDEELLVLAFGDCNVTLALCGHAIPSVRSQFLLTSSTARSTTTSGRALSRSLTIFCASINSSGVPRITIAFWLCTP